MMSGMKICKICKKEKSLSDYFAHKKSSDGRLGKCKSCHSEYGKKYYIENKEKINKCNNEYREKNKERMAVLTSEWQKKNPLKCNANNLKYKSANKEKVSKSAKIYSEKNKEKLRELRKDYYAKNKEKISASKKEWCKLNQGKRIASVAKRRAAKLNATVLWGCKKSIDSIYTLSSFLTLATFGDGYHVDHIVPLQGKLVCGLHVEDNLQILRVEDNLSKGSRYII